MAGKVKRNELYIKIAKETGISKREVKRAVEEQFAFVVKVMGDDEFSQVRLPYFGRFWAKETRIKWLEKHYGEKRDKK